MNNDLDKLAEVLKRLDIQDRLRPYTPSNPEHWTDPPPTTYGEALDRIFIAVKKATEGRKG